MNHFSTIVLCCVLLVPSIAAAQPGGGDRSDKPAYDRIESYKKVRMLEALKLGEDQSVKFVTRYTKHQETMRGFEKQRNELVDKLDVQAKSDAGDGNYDQIFNALLDIDKKIASERQQFLTELKEVLSDKQIAEYIVFERNFVQELRQAIRDVQRERLKEH